MVRIQHSQDPYPQGWLDGSEDPEQVFHYVTSGVWTFARFEAWYEQVRLVTQAQTENVERGNP